MTATTRRDIIQIAVSAGDNDNPDIIYALANDGTVWKRVIHTYKAANMWEVIEPIPQSRQLKPYESNC